LFTLSLAGGEDHKKLLRSIVAAPDLVGSGLLVFLELDLECGGQPRGLAELDPKRGGGGSYDTTSNGGSGGGGQDPVEEGMNRSAIHGGFS
jgi:hypothetical protein